MITAKILEVDTSKTTLKVKLGIDNGQIVDYWVIDSLASKLLSNANYALEFYSYEVTNSDGHNWIVGVNPV